MERPDIQLRPPKPGEYGWIVARHGLFYGAEQGWDALAFEAHVAGIIATFARAENSRQALWIATQGDQPVGSVGVVDDGRGTARLRLLILDPAARGQGLGRMLVAEALGFARARGDGRMVLSTYASLQAARSLYAVLGFRLAAATPVHHWGCDLIEEEWSLEL